MCIQLEIAYSCGTVLHKFNCCGFPILSDGNCPRGASQIPMLSHDTECDLSQPDHGSSGILKQHFLQIDRENCRPLTKMIHSGSPIRGLVNRTKPADFVLLVLEHVELLVYEHGTTKPSAKRATKTELKALIVRVQLLLWQGIRHIRGPLKARDFLGQC
jgi:hypothetical protein